MAAEGLVEERRGRQAELPDIEAIGAADEVELEVGDRDVGQPAEGHRAGEVECPVQIEVQGAGEG